MKALGLETTTLKSTVIWVSQLCRDTVHSNVLSRYTCPKILFKKPIKIPLIETISHLLS